MIGGSCINVACIPTKTMVKSAKVAEWARRARDFGIHVTFDRTDPLGIREHKRAVVTQMVARNQANFDHSGMRLLIGTARFTGARSLEVQLRAGGVSQLTADRIFINTGTRSALPPLPGLAEAQPLHSESIQELDRLPGHLVILGGGYIGCEFAQMFRRFGSQVTLVQRGQAFLPREDRDVADQVPNTFARTARGTLAASVRQIEGVSGQSVQLRLQTPGGERTLEGTDLLVALGRVPNTEDLNLAAAGIDTDDRGFIQVNERLETTARSIWALGDVNGGPQFTHASFDDWRIVTANLAGGTRSTTDRLIPYTLFIDPELGRIGLTETEARRRALPVRIARMAANKIPRAMTSGETRGYLKAVIDAQTNSILGASILATEGGEVMAVIQVAMQAGLRIRH